MTLADLLALHTKLEALPCVIDGVNVSAELDAAQAALWSAITMVQAEIDEQNQAEYAAYRSQVQADYRGMVL